MHSIECHPKLTYDHGVYDGGANRIRLIDCRFFTNNDAKNFSILRQILSLLAHRTHD